MPAVPVPDFAKRRNGQRNQKTGLGVNEFMQDDKVVIVSAVRTPFGRLGGALRDVDCYELGAISMRGALNAVNLDPALIEEVYWGVGDTSSCKDVYTPIAGRQSALKAGIPDTTPTCTLDKACVSGTSAVALGVKSIKLGDAEVVLAGGATTFSQEPFILRNMRFAGRRMGDVTLEDPLVWIGYKDYNPVALDAGNRAVANGISREEQDKWALRSHQLYGKALAEGKFQGEILPFNKAKDGKDPVWLTRDEQYRPDSTLERLSKLKTVYGSPTVTAGNAPGLNDGSASLILMSGKKAAELGLTPIAEIIAYSCVAGEPDHIPEIPAKAIQYALKRAGLTTDDLKLIEINEAFAVMPLASTKILGNGDQSKVEELRAKTNVNGGAIAIGHANTATGGRLVMTLAYELKRRGGGYGVAAICGGLGQGDAIIIRV